MSLETLLDPIKWHLRSWEEIRNMTWFTISNYTNVFAFLFFLGIAIYQAKGKVVREFIELELICLLMLLYTIRLSFILCLFRT